MGRHVNGNSIHDEKDAPLPQKKGKKKKKKGVRKRLKMRIRLRTERVKKRIKLQKGKKRGTVLTS